jgi:DNA-binding HxlR family transcriptional regulator
MEQHTQLPPHNREACKVSVMAVKDALYVLSGKWKLPLILTLSTGPQRFKEIQRTMGDITPKILTKELRELEDNGFVARKVLSTRPVTVLYELTPYSRSLDKVLEELRNWGMQHRQKIMHPLTQESGEESDESTNEGSISTLFQ